MKVFKNRWKNSKKPFSHIAIRAGLFLGTLALLIAIFTVGTKSYRVELHEGNIASRDMFAPFDFTYKSGIDTQATEKVKATAAGLINPVYDYNDEMRRAPLEYVEGLFKMLGSVKKDPALEEGQLAQLKEKYPEIKESSFLVLLKHENAAGIMDEAVKITERIGLKPVLAKSAKDNLRRQGRRELIIRDPRSGSEEVLKVSNTMGPEDVRRGFITDSVNEVFKDDVKLKAAVSDVLKNAVSPNIKENVEEFSKRMDKAKAGVPDVLREIDVKKGEIILEKGQRIKRHHLLQLEEIYGDETSRGAKFGTPFSMSVVILFLLVISVMTLKRYGPKVYNNNAYLFLIAIVSVTFLVGARLINNSFLSSYFIPIASASMLLAILLNENSAFLITLMLSIGSGIIVGNKLDVMLICLIGGAVGVYAVRGLRKRFRLLQAGLLVGCANFIIISSFGILRNFEPNVFLVEAGIGFSTGIIASFIVMGLLPVFEYLFQITTDITLLELSDLNHPLLKELTLKGPGTYHHSLLVGNLAEAACDAIGANSLLARVGSYYHDIGKIEKAEYFGENVVDGNVTAHHDKISPSMSALVITSHVKDGVELAEKYKMPQAIVDFIRQHHGDTLIYYFYQRALEKVVDETQLKDEDFRYPGPRPQTKETAIVLLADAVEASSRVLSKPTPARIEGLVRKIINNKFIDGQLDECELTLKDLNKIAESFVRVLTGVFHSRVEYPEAEEKPRVKSNGKETKKNGYPKRQADTKDSQKDA